MSKKIKKKDLLKEIKQLQNHVKKLEKKSFDVASSLKFKEEPLPVWKTFIVEEHDSF